MDFFDDLLLTFGVFFAAFQSSVWLLKDPPGNADGSRFLRSAKTDLAAGDHAHHKLDLDKVIEADVEGAARMINGRQISRFKRAIDITACIGLFFVLAPLLLAAAIAIKIDSRGPLIYRQRRVGLNGAEFDVLKFRSMFTDAEKGGPQYASAEDKRITRVGRIIRKTRIDEIPQIINVLRGEMSFVGPRPERPEFVVELEREIPHYQRRHLIKPGITGWAQVKYEYAATVEGAREKLTYDLYYIRHFTPFLDIIIILMTVRVALFGLGSR